VATSAFAPVPRKRALGTPPVRTLGRSLMRVLAWTAIGLGLGLALAVFGPAVAGYRSFTVLSGSMVPELQVGDLVVDEPLAASEIRRGDVITFPDPEQAGRLITHRVRGIRIHGTTVDVTTRGDANNTVEQWSIAATGSVGRVVYRLPWLGYAMVTARSRAGRIGLLVLPALALGFLGLRAVWRPRPTLESA
jgi:signal peptidase I